MRSRNSSNFSAMDPIQKMEILENYPYMLHGLSQQHLPNQIQNDDSHSDAAVTGAGDVAAAAAVAPSTMDTIKTEPLDACDVIVNGNGNGVGDSGGDDDDCGDLHNVDKSNDQKLENSQSESSNGGGGGNGANTTKYSSSDTNGNCNGNGNGDAHVNGVKKRKYSSTVDTTSSSANASSDENGESKTGNDDYHFLMSMQPFMSELSLAQKLRLRMKIQKLVFDELYGCYNDMRT